MKIAPVFKMPIFRTENPSRSKVLRLAGPRSSRKSETMPKAITMDQVLNTLWTEYQLGTRTGEFPISKKLFRDTMVGAEVARTTVTINNLWQILQTKRVGNVPLVRREPFSGKLMLNIDATRRWLNENGYRVESRISPEDVVYIDRHTDLKEGA